MEATVLEDTEVSLEVATEGVELATEGVKLAMEQGSVDTEQDTELGLADTELLMELVSTQVGVPDAEEEYADQLLPVLTAEAHLAMGAAKEATLAMEQASADTELDTEVTRREATVGGVPQPTLKELDVLLKSDPTTTMQDAKQITASSQEPTEK
jgi:hypothetical protein